MILTKPLFARLPIVAHRWQYGEPLFARLPIAPHRWQYGESIIKNAHGFRRTTFARNDCARGDDHRFRFGDGALEAIVMADGFEDSDDKLDGRMFLRHARERARVARQRLHHGD
jgi:hypothetical protein